MSQASPPAAPTASAVVAAGSVGDGVPAVRLTGITKHYPGVRANDAIDLEIRRGTIHGLLGENGAGKSTLMKILFGLAHADAGTIEIDGIPQVFRSPADALAVGVGMVQQHFSLVGDFTVAENLVLGHEPRVARLFIDEDRGRREVQEFADRYGFRLDAKARVGDMAVGARQRVEILKVLYRGAQVLILDEPTAALAPPEVEELFGVLRQLRDQNRTVIFISHKLPEVIAVCDRVSVLRDGRVVGHREIGAEDRVDDAAASRAGADLALMMVGRPLPEPPIRAGTAGDVVLSLRGVCDGAGLGPLDLDVRSGEIVGVAGVEGNGQTELVEILVGVRPCAAGKILLRGEDITRWPVGRRLKNGLAHIAEDRHVAAVALDLPLVDNGVLGFHDQEPYARRRLFLARRAVQGLATELVRRFGVRTSSVQSPMRSLSGGNQQKFVVGREMARQPKLMIAAQPTRGLDIGATAFVHDELASLRASGAAVLLVSLELSEVYALADRMIVLYNGRVAGEARPGAIDVATLGAWMTGTSTPSQAASA